MYCTCQSCSVTCPIQGLDALFSEWGDQDCHAPILLGWALLNFASKQHSEGLVVFRLLGNRALKAHVFEYLLRVLSSSFFSKNRVSDLSGLHTYV